ncbi:MAG TPA: hypothetical protein VG692_11125 [Gemmatimonadales bacterium]|nr:hypothetical protein [Gemmatimonadales bacterium]
MSTRSGVALPLALFTIVLAAVMITAVFYVGRLEQRMGNNSIAATRAFEAAESGITAVLNSWSTTYSGMLIGDTRTTGQVTVATGTNYTAYIRRLNSVLFLVQSEGRFQVGGVPVTRRQVARLVRLLAPDLSPDGALTTRLGLTVKDDARIDGADNIPPNWGFTCAAPFPSVPAIVDSAGPIITDPNCAGGSCLTGSTPIWVTTQARMSAYTTFGAVDFPTLAGSAERVVSGPVSGIQPSITGSPSQCNTGDVNNWGDPLDPSGRCWNYFPIIYSPGDLELQSGYGQGVLLVQGNLTISGDFRFFGVIVVQGTVTTTGTSTGRVYGALMTASVAGLPDGSIGGAAQILYSHCAIDRSVTGASVAESLRERGWMQLY